MRISAEYIYILRKLIKANNCGHMLLIHKKQAIWRKKQKLLRSFSRLLWLFSTIPYYLTYSRMVHSSGFTSSFSNKLITGLHVNCLKIMYDPKITSHSTSRNIYLKVYHYHFNSTHETKVLQMFTINKPNYLNGIV